MKNSMKTVILIIYFSIIVLNTSGQEKYLKLTGEKHNFPNIFGGIIEKKIPEGAQVKIRSTAE